MENMQEINTQSTITEDSSSGALLQGKSYSVFKHAPRTLYDLVEQFHQTERQQNDDQITDLRNLKMNTRGNVQVPGLGEFALNDWSRKQLANLVGVKWDRWFNEADPIEQAEEINRRFIRRDQQIQLRSTRMVDPEIEADGTLQAFVSPGYTPVADSLIARMMLHSMRDFESEFRIIRADVSDKTVSYVIGVGHPYQIGGPGEVGDVWGGILVRNSNVSASSLQIVLFLTRLSCRNGMTAPLKNAELFRHRHTKGIAGDGLFKLLGSRMLEIPGQLRNSGQIMLNANRSTISEPRETVEWILGQNKLPKRLIEPIMLAYYKEPRANAFGISSAFTRAAQEYGPEERLDIEKASSRYLMTLS
ncbi:MAG: hypothetical protein V1897_01210 [Pseudomonadota bacterium]